MKNIFVISIIFFFTLWQTAFAQHQGLVKKMQQEKIVISQQIEQDTLNVSKDWHKISSQISELSDDLDAYDKSLRTTTADTANKNGVTTPEDLPPITKVKIQLSRCNIGVLKMNGTILLQKVQGGHEKQIEELRVRILNDSKVLDILWKELFSD